MAVRMKLTADEVTQIRALLREGVHTTRAAIAEQLGYRADTFTKLVARQQDAREAFTEFSMPVTPYCALAKTHPKPRTTKAGRPLKEIPERRIPDIEFWAAKGHGQRRIADEMNIPLKVFNAQAKADPRLIEAFDLGRDQRQEQLIDQLIANGKDPGLQFVLRAEHGLHDKPATVQDNRTQIVHVSINEPMERDQFLEYIDA